MGGDRLPALPTTFGPHNRLGLDVYDLMLVGRCTEALELADANEPIARTLGDERSVALIVQVRMYSLIRLERWPEALAAGDVLLAAQRRDGGRVNEAKALADTAEILIRMGRLDDGLYRLAEAIVMLDGAPRANPRYAAALSSVCGAAGSAQLYELADDTADLAIRLSATGNTGPIALQRAELSLDWALALEQIGRTDDATRHYARTVRLMSEWLNETDHSAHGAPMATANLAVALAKLGRYEAAERLAVSLIEPMRAARHDLEARKAHLAYGVVLRGRGDADAARREFIAAVELAEDPAQRLFYQYEMALLAASNLGRADADALLDALRAQAAQLWRVRLERRAMMQQARRRVELEAANAAADRAVAQDALTGLGNRRQFDRRIAEPADGSVLLLIDIDNFKTINDSYSHQTGDRVLGEVAAALRAHCRAGDTAIRLGGDEFAMFVRAEPAAAARTAERIRGVLAARDWTQFGPGLRVTLSIGLASRTLDMDGPTWYDHADRQLYEAKRRGRDQVCWATPRLARSA